MKGIQKGSKIREDASDCAILIEDSVSDTPEVAHEIQTDELSPVSAGDHPSFPSDSNCFKLSTDANCQAIWEIWGLYFIVFTF